MIKRVSLKNFKAGHDLSLRLGSLTLLTGMNSSGKSTVLQSFALLRQSNFDGVDDSILLHGEIVKLGTFGELRTEGGQGDSIEIEIQFSSAEPHKAKVAFLATDLASTRISAHEICGDWGAFRETPFCFLHADRISPQPLYPRTSGITGHGGVLGTRGEYVADFLSSIAAQDIKVSSTRRAPVTSSPVSAEVLEKVAPTEGLMDQVAAWLQYLSPGVRIRSDLLLGTDSARLMYDYVGRTGVLETDKKIRPANVGFGLTYSLPIIVSCLVAEPGSMLLIENPEAHLHPRGQFAMGELLSKVASDGVQVLVETHSDHVVNAVRLAVKNSQVPADNVAIHFFSRDLATGFADVETPAVLDDGKLSAWPPGFFDQWDIAVDALLR